VIRDWTIIRAVLLKLESVETANTALHPSDLPPFEEQHVAYNMRLLTDAGYIRAKILESSTGDGRIAAVIARSLTNSGHDLLDTIRSDTVWRKVQDRFRSQGLEMTFDLVVMVGKKIMESMLS
jgi:hypothetical protein